MCSDWENLLSSYENSTRIWSVSLYPSPQTAHQCWGRIPIGGLLKFQRLIGILMSLQRDRARRQDSCTTHGFELETVYWNPVASFCSCKWHQPTPKIKPELIKIHLHFGKPHGVGTNKAHGTMDLVLKESCYFWKLREWQFSHTFLAIFCFCFWENVYW